MKSYQRIDQSLLDDENVHQVFQNVADHLSDILGENWHPLTNIESINGLPAAARNVWYLWWFSAEVGGNGLSAWVANIPPPAKVIIASHSALKTIKAAELLELLEASFAPARVWDAPFLHEPEVAWFDQFRGNHSLPTFDEIDPPSYNLASQPLSTLVAEYVRTNRAEL